MRRISPSPRVVSNSSPLIHLAKIGRLDLLRLLFGEVLVPEAVYRECVVEGGGREDARKIGEAGWIRVSSVRDVRLKRVLLRELDEGEAEAIVLALEESADLVILDEREARRMARSLGLKVTGTIGILMRARREGVIQNLRGELDRLLRSGFWISRDLYERILREERGLGGSELA